VDATQASGGAPSPGDVAEQEWLAAVARDLDPITAPGYRDLAAALRAAIAGDRLPVGRRLPPQRELARRLAVGRTTVVSAYNLLRAESLLEARQGAGTWVVRRP
jgi:DNA-binding GntR family transcriptional regulator